MTERIRYSRELLEEILNEGNATLLGEYEKFNQRMHVRFRCRCGEEEVKRFEMLNQNRLPYCKGCSNELIQKRRREYFLEKIGVDNPSKSEEIKQKIKGIYLEKYGDHPKRTKEVQQKWMETCFQKYGGHPNQNPDVQEKHEKKSYYFKNYTLPSGKIVRIQGYEGKALDILLKSYKEEEIILGRKNIPRIEYFIGDTKHIYYPDFFIPKENKIIEVKSEWTSKLDRSYLEEKCEATAQAGYICEVWMYNSKGQHLKTITYTCIEKVEDTS